MVAFDFGVEIKWEQKAPGDIPAIIGSIVRSDRGADDGGADQAYADAPAEAAASGLSLGGGGSKAAGEGKRGQRERGNSGLDRHEKLHPVVGGPLWVRVPSWTGLVPFRFDSPPRNSKSEILARYFNRLAASVRSWGRTKACPDRIYRHRRA